MAENENHVTEEKKGWRIRANRQLNKLSKISLKSVLLSLYAKLRPDDERPVIPLGHGDPSACSCFSTDPAAEEAVSDALLSAKFNGYPTPVGILPARKAVADYLSRDLPYKLSPEDIYMTLGCNQAVGVALAVLAGTNANILLPRPGFPLYEACADFYKLEARHFDLLPDKGWEVDLDGVEALADENTVAMVVINPGNPCGSVYTYQHLQKVAETAKKLGIMVIADEVYHHLAFGSNPFIPMAVFGSIAPVLTLGSISKRWMVPGWRLGWLATTDPNGILTESGFVESLKGYFTICPNLPTFIQGAVPQLLEKTCNEFFTNTLNILRREVDICWEKLKEIPCITCPHKPEGGMFVMVKLDVSQLDDIDDDVEFSYKLVEEESVIVVPATVLGLKNWLRISFATEPTTLEEGFGRMKAFCQRHAKKLSC